MGWIEDLIDETKEAESPTSFFFWSGLSAISAVLKNNVWFPKGGLYNVYPNIYAMLIARSATCRKGYPVKLAQKLVKQVGNTRVISGTNSIQGVMTALSTTETSPNGGPPNTDSSAFLSSDEFAAFLIEDPQSFTLLTTLYDTHYNTGDEFKKTLRSGNETMKNPCITLLGASNQALFNEAIPKSAHSGGFIGRTIMTVESKKRRINALMRKAPGVNFPKLVSYLKLLATLRGEFDIQPCAIDYFENWYQEFSEKIEKMDDPTGTLDRLHDQVLKVSMLLQLSDQPEPCIRIESMERAVELCQASSSSAKRMTIATGEDELAKPTKIIMTTLLSEEGNCIDRMRLLSRNYGNFNSIVLDKVVTSLFEAGALTINLEGNKTIYRLTPNTIKAFSELEGRK